MSTQDAGAKSATWNRYGHMYSGRQLCGYGVCDYCGAGENQDRITKPCEKSPLVKTVRKEAEAGTHTPIGHRFAGKQVYGHEASGMSFYSFTPFSNPIPMDHSAWPWPRTKAPASWREFLEEIAQGSDGDYMERAQKLLKGEDST